MLIRSSKLVVLFGTSLLFLLIASNNIIDPYPNRVFAHHVVSMDTVAEKSSTAQRAIVASWVSDAAFVLIVSWEIGVTILCTVGLFNCIRALSLDCEHFQRAKTLPLVGLSLAMLLWVGGFLAIGGEWFSMWLSPQWNGQNFAARMAFITGLTILCLERPDD